MKVITFSRSYPDYHSENGKPTFFVEKILNNIGINYLPDTYFKRLCEWNIKSLEEYKLSLDDLKKFYLSLQEVAEDKGHTIRAGSRFKAGEKFSPRVWSEKPYNSPHIIFAPPLEIVKIWNYEVRCVPNFEQWFINGTCISQCNKENWFNAGIIEAFAANDGLEIVDFLEWFKHPSDFKGNIICWDSTIKY